VIRKVERPRGWAASEGAMNKIAETRVNYRMRRGDSAIFSRL